MLPFIPASAGNRTVTSIPRMAEDGSSPGGDQGALAHVVGNRVEAAYARSDLFERRRVLMDNWARYLAQGIGCTHQVEQGNLAREQARVRARLEVHQRPYRAARRCSGRGGDARGATPLHFVAVDVGDPCQPASNKAFQVKPPP